MKIQILVDNPSSWILPHAKDLVNTLNNSKRSVELITKVDEISTGDILVLLSCETILDEDQLSHHEYNLVVHESDLPEGRGWSPLTWQVLEGESRIPVTLLEAASEVDSGLIYYQKWMDFEGTELIDEMRSKQAEYTKDLIKQFINDYPDITGRLQQGDPSYYPKRTPSDSELDPNQTIKEQFDLLRVVDNERYPAFFQIDGEKYILKISKAD